MGFLQPNYITKKIFFNRVITFKKAARKIITFNNALGIHLPEV